MPSPGATAFSPEAAIAAQLILAYQRGDIPFQEVVAALDNRNVPPQLKQTPFSVTLADGGAAPQLLIPENKNRMGWLIAFTDSNLAAGVVFFTYGAPPAPGFGLPLFSGIPFGESNGTVSIDAIWVAPAANLPNPATYPITIIAYEGSLAIESHRHSQTRNLRGGG